MTNQVRPRERESTSWSLWGFEPNTLSGFVVRKLASDSCSASKNDAIRMREESQEYAQQLLNNLEQDLNRLYQVVMNGQQRLQEMRVADNANQQAGAEQRQ